MDTAAAILERIKADDANNIGLVTLIHQDPSYLRLTAAWPNAARLIERDSEPTEVCPPDTPVEDRVRWLWARVEPAPEPLWSAVAGLPDAPHVYRAMRVLQDWGVVFPDGTLSVWAQRLLTSKAKALGVKEPVTADDAE